MDSPDDDVTLADMGPTDADSLAPRPSGWMLSRRRFITYAGAVGAGFLAGGIVESLLARDFAGSQTQTLTTYPRVLIANLRDLSIGKPRAFSYPLAGQPSALVKLGRPALDGAGSERDIVAFSTTCVHMGCPLAGRYKADNAVLGPCPCHLSTYDLALAGMPVAGAATENLPQIELTVNARGDIYALGVWGVIYGYADNLTSATASGS